MITTNKIKLKTIIEYFLILLLLFFTIVLRASLFKKNNYFSGDLSRDLLAGHLIANKEMHTQYGHWNSGTSGTYPPYYYYMHALVNKVTNDNFNLIILFLITLQSLPIIVLYLIAKNICSSYSAFTIATLYAIAPRFIDYNNLLLSAHSTILLISVSALFLIQAKKNKHISYLLLCSAFFALSNSIFFGSILLLPIFLAYIYIFFDNKKIHHTVVFIFSFCIFMFLLYLPVLSQFMSPEYLTNTENNLIQGLMSQNFSSLISALPKTIVTMVIYFETLFKENTFIILCMFVGCGVIALKKRSSRLFSIIVILVYCLYFFLFSLLKDPLGHYMLPTYFLLFLGLIYILKFAENKIFFLVPLSLFLIVSSGVFDLSFYLANDNSFKEVAYIEDQIHTKFPNSVILYHESCMANELSWDTKNYWYFQKDYINFILSNEYNQVGYNAQNYEEIYLCSAEKNQANEMYAMFNLSNTYKLEFNISREYKEYFIYSRS